VSEAQKINENCPLTLYGIRMNALFYLKGQFTQKLGFCHHLLALKLF